MAYRRSSLEVSDVEVERWKRRDQSRLMSVVFGREDSLLRRNILIYSKDLIARQNVYTTLKDELSFQPMTLTQPLKLTSNISKRELYEKAGTSENPTFCFLDREI